MTGNGKRAVLYYRQSKARDDSISIDIQREQCLAYCARAGYRVLDEVSDPGVSGYRDWTKRPNFPRVLDVDADVVVVYRWSRLSRRRRDQVNLIAMLEDSGKAVESAVEPVDITTAGGLLSRDVMMTVAAFESDVKSEQWKEALARRVSKGLPRNGLPRWGYRKQGGIHVPDPETGLALREMYTRYTQGAGFQSLVADLNRRGMRTTRGGDWTVHSLIRALDSGFGAGLLVHDRGKSYTDGAHEGVITREEWDAYRRAREARRALPAKRKNPRWFLAGLVKCGTCGGAMFVNSYASPKSQVICSRYKASRSCSGQWVSRIWVEQRVAVWVGGHIDEMPERVPERDEERARVVSTIETLSESLEAVQQRLGKLAEGWATGLLDDEAYRRAQEAVAAQRDDIARQLVAAREELDRLAPVDRDVYARLESDTDMTAGEWGALLSRVIRRIEVHKDRLVIAPVVGEASIVNR